MEWSFYSIKITLPNAAVNYLHNIAVNVSIDVKRFISWGNNVNNARFRRRLHSAIVLDYKIVGKYLN